MGALILLGIFPLRTRREPESADQEKEKFKPDQPVTMRDLKDVVKDVVNESVNESMKSNLAEAEEALRIMNAKLTIVNRLGY